MHKPIKFDAAAFADLWHRGVCVREIGAMHGVSRNWASATAKKLGLPRRQAPRNAVSPYAIVAAYENGLSTAEIARQLRRRFPTISPTTVARAVRIAGHALRPSQARAKVSGEVCVRLLRAGWSRGQIAARFGVRTAVVGHAIRRLIGSGPHGGSNVRVDVARILRMQSRGVAIRAIARAVGCAPSVVQRHVRKARQAAPQAVSA